MFRVKRGLQGELVDLHGRLGIQRHVATGEDGAFEVVKAGIEEVLVGIVGSRILQEGWENHRQTRTVRHVVLGAPWRDCSNPPDGRWNKCRCV